MKHGIYILTFFMTLLGLSESGYAMIPFFTATGDTVRRAVIYFEVSETCVDSCYGSNNQVIAVLDSLLARNSDTKYITALNVITSVSPEDDESYNTNLISKRNHSVSSYNDIIRILMLIRFIIFQLARIGQSYVSWRQLTLTCRIVRKC